MMPILAILVVVCGAGGAKEGARTHISAQDLAYGGTYDVVGKLGIPMGRLVEVRAKFTYGEESEYCLEIAEVGGAPLNTPVKMTFEDRTSNVPADDFGRYEQVYGQKTGSLSEDQIKALRTGWVDTEYDLVVFETGKFGGPDNWEEFGLMPYQGMGSGLRTWLVIERVLMTYKPPQTESVAWLRPEERPLWKKLNGFYGEMDIVVISGVEFKVNGVQCRLFGVSLPEDRKTQARAKKFLKRYTADYGKYHSIYNGNEPICDMEGIPLIFLAGHGNGGWAQEVLVQAGLVDVDYRGYEKYTFTVPTKSGSQPCNWQKMLGDAEESFKNGEAPNINFKWRQKK